MGIRKREKTLFGESATVNNLTYMQYLNRLTELSVSMFEWKNLPPTVDARYLELHLFETGSMVYFNDEVIGNLCLDCLPSGRLDVYGNPVLRRAYSGYNNYQKLLKESNSVIIWNNYLHTNSVLDVKMFAKRLYNLDRIIDVNANAQKTPILIQGTEQQRLTLKNLYKEFDGNSPFIFGDKNLDLNSLKCLQTGAPYVCDKLYNLKQMYWNEALTYLGINNTGAQKRERMLAIESSQAQGGTISSRYSRLQSRREAVEKINAMFGTNIEVNYREDFMSIYEGQGVDTTEGESEVELNE
jgi:upper collar protein